jgi:Phytanoyl-CoA dioxygenase (PhyH)
VSETAEKKPAGVKRQLERRIRKLRDRRATASYALHTSIGSNLLARRRFDAHRPDLDEVQRRLVEGLAERGVATTSFDDLLREEDLWVALRDDMDGYARDAERGLPSDPAQLSKKSDYVIRDRPTALAPGDPWLRFGTSPRILDVVNSYRGLWTKLVDVERWYTVPFPHDDKRVSSQNWHRDPRDLHIVKVFLYFSDVDDDAGPLQYVAGSPSGGPYGDLWPWEPYSPKYPPRKRLEKKVPEDDRVSLVGRKGTLIFCDTSGFHRGGFAKTKPRVLSIHTYISPASLRARLDWDGPQRSFEVEWAGGPDGLPETAAYALK